MRLSSLCVAAIACHLGVAAEEAAACAEGATGVCEPQATVKPTAEHLLLQVNKRFSVQQHGDQVKGDAASHAQAKGGCSNLRNVEKDCGSGGCKVLADGMQGRTCAQYCGESGLACIGAWEEEQETCAVQATMTCTQTWPGTSDLICECDPSRPAPATGPGGRTLVWSDEFDGGAVDTSKWRLLTGGGGFGNEELQHYTDRPTNAHVDGGTLKIEAKCEKYGHEHFTSAKLSTEAAAAWGPGHRIEVRARLPAGEGSWPAIWMMPRDKAYGEWPKSGEIDIMEAVGCAPGKVHATVHTEAYNHIRHTEKQNSLYTDIGDWRVYAVDWEEKRLQWSMDGRVYHTFTPDDYGHDKWPFDREFYLILNLAVGGQWGGYCLHNGWPSCSLPSQFGRPNVLEVDYARVYKLDLQESLVEVEEVDQ